MTPERAKELLPLIKAYSEGKQIQVRDLGDRYWLDITDPEFNSPADCYRIKPEKRVRYVNVFPDGDFGTAWELKSIADRPEYARDRVACIRIEYEEGQYDD